MFHRDVDPKKLATSKLSPQYYASDCNTLGKKNVTNKIFLYTQLSLHLLNLRRQLILLQ